MKGISLKKEIKQEAVNETAQAAERNGAARGILYELLILLIKIAVIIGVFVAIFTFVFGIFRTADASMHPTIRDGDLVIYYRFDKNYVASDTIVVRYNEETQARRVVAVAGDTVDFSPSGQLKVNGSAQQEGSIYEKTFRLDTGIEFPLTLKEGEVFVLGDGREHSTDSRVYGPVRIEDSLGKVTIVIRTRRT